YRHTTHNWECVNTTLSVHQRGSTRTELCGLSAITHTHTHTHIHFSPNQVKSSLNHTHSAQYTHTHTHSAHHLMARGLCVTHSKKAFREDFICFGEWMCVCVGVCV